MEKAWRQTGIFSMVVVFQFIFLFLPLAFDAQDRRLAARAQELSCRREEMR
jgi:hypothetical protein